MPTTFRVPGAITDPYDYSSLTNPEQLRPEMSVRVDQISDLLWARERQSFWSRLFGTWNGNTVWTRPARIYPPYSSLSEMILATHWARWDSETNRYGETNVIRARNIANERTETIVNQLLEQLERLFGQGRFGGQNRDWLRRGLEAAGRFGMAGAAGGPYVAVATALAGFVMSACQDLWPGQKQSLLDTWRGILRDCTTLERYLLLPYMREIAVVCFRLEPGWSDPEQPGTDPWRWGTQPQPFGHNIVGAGPLGICTFLGEILLEHDCFPVPARVVPPPEMIAALRTQGGPGIVLAEILSRPGKTIPDPLFVKYVAAVLGADHPGNYFLRDIRHREGIYGNLSDPRGSLWVKQEVWPAIRSRRVSEVKAEAADAGLRGMSPTFYTREIDRALVDAELPEAGR